MPSSEEIFSLRAAHTAGAVVIAGIRQFRRMEKRFTDVIEGDAMNAVGNSSVQRGCSSTAVAVA